MKRFLIYSGLIIFILIAFSTWGKTQGEQLIFSIQDPVNDDYGPGTYKYPTDKIFEPYKGLFDLTQFEVWEGNNKYILNFSFEKITNPWNGKYGFSHPLIELYIDNKKGGSTSLFKEGANVKLDPNHAWNKLLKISGWWVRLFEPDDREKDVVNLASNDNKSSYDVKNCEVHVDNNMIQIVMDKSKIGSLKDSYLYILIGSFDPFGLDHFRGVKGEPSNWYFNDSTDDKLHNAPRVIDIVLPKKLDQKEVLGEFKDDYPSVYPLQIASSQSLLSLANQYLTYIILFAIIVVFILIKITKKPDWFNL